MSASQKFSGKPRSEEVEEQKEQTDAENLQEAKIMLPLRPEVVGCVLRKTSADELGRTERRHERGLQIVSQIPDEYAGADGDGQGSTLGKCGGKENDLTGVIGTSACLQRAATPDEMAVDEDLVETGQTFHQQRELLGCAQ